MEHLVLVDFVDKESGVYIASGSCFESNDYERVMGIEKMGFIKAHQDVSTLKKVEEKKKTRKKAGVTDAGES